MMTRGEEGEDEDEDEEEVAVGEEDEIIVTLMYYIYCHNSL